MEVPNLHTVPAQHGVEDSELHVCASPMHEGGEGEGGGGEGGGGDGGGGADGGAGGDGGSIISPWTRK
jgi:hypothetical protein